MGMDVGSRLPSCPTTYLDFTLFQSLVSIPLGTTLTDFSVVMGNADNGARVSIINSENPAPGRRRRWSYIFLGGAQPTANLASLVVAGEVNRVVVTQVDDCAVANHRVSAAIVLNGSVIPPNQPPTATAGGPDNGSEGSPLTITGKAIRMRATTSRRCGRPRLAWPTRVRPVRSPMRRGSARP